MTNSSMCRHFQQTRRDRKLIRLARSTSIVALMATWFALPQTALADNDRIIHRGDMAVSGFSGIQFPDGGLPPGVNPIDETFINTEGASLRIFSLRNIGAPPKGQLVNTPPPFEVKASQIGQVFGLAFDDGIRDGSVERVPNLYATASTAHGLNLVVADNDGDGRPERIKTGQDGAGFMSGQFGIENGGGPGSIWRIDGLTGEVSLFANVTLDGTENSGPGLGNIAFDRASRQLFVADRDTGMMHRYDLAGNDLGHFDHGIQGRPNKGLDAIGHDDANRMNISSPVLQISNPETWGFATADRQVYGLAVHHSRLFYSVGEAPQIWSVGIHEDGGFADDARWELDVAADHPHPVTDIAFDRQGVMYLAQRGQIQNAYDYANFATPAESEVLRYYKESPDDPATESVWIAVPDTYAVGFPEGHRMATGGIDLGYGYDENGVLRSRACGDVLAKTGDALRDNPGLADQLSSGGPFAVHGVQLTDSALVRPDNEPPFQSYFVDFDSAFDDPEVRGHVGDVEIWKDCRGYDTGERIPYPGDTPDPGSPCLDVDRVEYYCDGAWNLHAEVIINGSAGIGGNSLKVQSLKPGISLSPEMQTRPAPALPFDFSLSGVSPNEVFKVDVCFYNSLDAAAGGSFPCCKAQITLKAPSFSCGP